MRHEVGRPLCQEGYAKKVQAVAARLIEQWCAENPDLVPVLRHEWDSGRCVMTLRVGAA